MSGSAEVRPLAKVRFPSRMTAGRAEVAQSRVRRLHAALKRERPGSRLYSVIGRDVAVLFTSSGIPCMDSNLTSFALVVYNRLAIHRTASAPTQGGLLLNAIEVGLDQIFRAYCPAVIAACTADARPTIGTCSTAGVFQLAASPPVSRAARQLSFR